jgi:fructokinase
VVSGSKSAASPGAAPQGEAPAGSAGRPLEVLCLGEALVDLLPDRRGLLRDCERFEVHSGGAPANVAVGLARLGRRTGFHGVLGDDEFGHLLERKLSAEGIACSLRFTGEAPTGMWFIALDQQGNRSFFTPSGAASADKLITVADVERADLSRCGWLHTGSSCHVRPAAQEALLAALQAARRSGTRTCSDPNVRVRLWNDLRELRALCERAFALCDVVKVSDDEGELCLGEREPERIAGRLVEEFGVKLACVTLGARGALARRGSELFRIPAPQVEVVDTTGAGDGFVAGLLSRLAAPATAPLETLPAHELESALRFACAVGSRVCTAPGAVTALPRAGEL